MTNHPIYYFGETRFSIFNPKSRDWRLTRSERQSEDEYAKVLFSDARLEPRIKIFTEIAAPIYQKMSEGRNYKHFVYYSSELPQKWQERLFETAEEYPVIHPVESKLVRTVQRARDHLADISEKQDAYVFCFRVDDDDLVSSDFLSLVEPLLCDTNEGFAVSFASGYAALFEDGKYTTIRQHVSPLIAIGLGVIGKWYAKDQLLPLEFIRNHSRTHYLRTVLLDAQRPTFIHTRHVGQDTALTEGNLATSYQDRRNAVLDRLTRLPEVEDQSVVLERFPELKEYSTFTTLTSQH